MIALIQNKIYLDKKQNIISNYAFNIEYLRFQ